ncbi:MAG: sulfatase [Actinomycetota bacterium]|nr:sulfatase [Actinomycetota bacterium]
MPVALVVALLLLGGCSVGGGGSTTGGIAEGEGAPNVILIVTDDQDAASLEAMPAVSAQLANEGASFDRYFDSYPLCCPSRTSIWTGQYAHNHGVHGNFPEDDGGGYVNLIEPRRVLPVWLRRSGYETAHVGKWASVPGEIPPPGWDRWVGITQETSARYYEYTLYDSKPRENLDFGSDPGDYHTDVVTRTALGMIDEFANRRRPWLLSIAYLAPHLGLGKEGDDASERCNPAGEPVGAVPAPRHADAFADTPLPTPPSFDEADISDKATDLPGRLDAAERAELELQYQCRLASLASVDEGIDAIVEKLEQTGELDNTFVIFTSDNGFLLGEHRLAASKNLPYEESIRVPLVIRGPEIEPGTTIAAPSMNVDLAPTILELTDAGQPGDLARPEDGSSLAALLTEGGNEDADRAILIEGRSDTRESVGAYSVASYEAVRTARYALIREYVAPASSYEAGAEVGLGAGDLVSAELYDLEHDPYQLENVAGTAAYREVEAELSAALTTLSGCEGQSCEISVSLPAPT